MITELTFDKFEQIELNVAKILAKGEAYRQAHRAKALLRTSSHLNAELELNKVHHTICEEACSALHTHMSAYLVMIMIHSILFRQHPQGLPKTWQGV